MIGTLLVDDERLARVELRRLLEAYPEIQILGEASHVDEALAAIKEKKPDLVFLDIQMPSANGIEFYKSLSTSVMVIFTTAYSQYAIDGFNVNAIDYLLKPYTYTRFLQACPRCLASP